jgi:hypothetical protein
MLEKTKLEEISSQLPERERRELLAKIARSMTREERDELARIELKAEERERLLAEELTQLGWWVVLLLWLRRLFSGRSKRDLFIEFKIRQIKRGIRQKSSGLTGFETRNLTPKFARLLFDLYSSAYPLIPLCQAFHRDPEFRGRAIAQVFEGKIPEPKKDLQEFMSAEEMQRVYADSGSEEEVSRQLLRRYADYLKKIPSKLAHQVDEGIKPLLYLRPLVLYQYGSVFRNFRYTLPETTLEDKYPYFESASAVLMLESLERLWHALSLAARLGPDWFCHEELLGVYLRENEDEEQPSSSQETAQGASAIISALVGLVDAAGQFDRRVPVLQLLRYFRRDPYYRLSFAAPQLATKPVYAAALRERLLAALAETLVSVKRNVVERRLQELFKSQQLFELFYYLEKPSFDYAALGLPYFSLTRSLKVVYNYLSRVYKGVIQDTLQTLNTYVLSGNRLILTRLNQCASGLEELEAKIVLFDRSLSPDEEDGKNLLRLRHRLGTDLTQQKLYRGFVTSKDREASELIEQGKEFLLGIRRVFDDLLASPVENVKSLLKTLHFHKGKHQTLASLLRASSDLIGEFLGLLDQLLKLEKGT